MKQVSLVRRLVAVAGAFALTSAAKKVASFSKPGKGYNCPKGYPVKGNADSGIYHLPKNRFYSRTKPEECFKTAADAKRAGYRAAKV